MMYGYVRPRRFRNGDRSAQRSLSVDKNARASIGVNDNGTCDATDTDKYLKGVLASLKVKKIHYRWAILMVLFLLPLIGKLSMMNFFPRRLFSSRNTTSTVATSHHMKRHSIYGKIRQRKEAARPLPPLSELIKSQSVIGNVNSLLDFAILGHAKTGTTTMLHWIAEHPDVLTDSGVEIRHLEQNRVYEMVRYLYNLGKNATADTHHTTTTSNNNNQTIYRGYKSPQDITQQRSLQYIRQYFPDAKLIVGIRHPVDWFVSFYNYRLRSGTYMVSPDELIGHKGCIKHEVCTDGALFHRHLSFLGKTPRQDAAENDLFVLDEPNSPKSSKQPRPPSEALPNQIFLFETSQLADSSHLDRFRQDLSDFLELPSPLGSLTRRKNAASTTSGIKGMDICQHDLLRAVLMDISRKASMWIRNYFLQSPDVTVPCPDQFETILESWMLDPCTATKSWF